MTRRTLASLVAVALLAGSLLAVGDPPSKSDAAQLVEQLGSVDFAEREAASKALNTLGASALTDIRAACRSADPEVARRAKDLAIRIERRIENEKLLAPTFVNLTAEDVSLDTLLADLSKQSNYVVVLGGLKVDDLAAKKVTIQTRRVPFWEAVQKVCDAAGLQIATASGFTAPGSMPYASLTGMPVPGRAGQLAAIDRPRPAPLPAAPGPIGGQLEAAKKSAVRTGTTPHETIVLEARDAGKKRPFAVYGAVCIEAFPLPVAAARADLSLSLLQVWPEPKLKWTEVNGQRIQRAVDDRGQSLMTLHELPDLSNSVERQRVLIAARQRAAIANANNGGVVVLNGGFEPTSAINIGFNPNTRQSVVKFHTPEQPPVSLKELSGALFGTVRSQLEALATASDLEVGKSIEANANTVSLKAQLTSAEKNNMQMTVELSYDSATVQPANANEELPGIRNAGRQSVVSTYGLRVADAAGNPFHVHLRSIGNRIDGSRRITYIFQMTLSATTTTAGVPKSVAFWGTYGKPVEVPFDLRDVPLVVGKK